MENPFDPDAPNDPLDLLPVFGERLPPALITEFVRRPARGWVDGASLPTARLDDTLTGLESLQLRLSEKT